MTGPSVTALAFRQHVRIRSLERLVDAQAEMVAGLLQHLESANHEVKDLQRRVRVLMEIAPSDVSELEES